MSWRSVIGAPIPKEKEEQEEERSHLDQLASEHQY